jgi:transcriptional regulator with XRE-family HTH domain
MKNTSYLSVLGLTLRDIREKLDIKQKPIADALSMTTAGWSKIEKGQSAISAANLNKVAKVFNMNTSSILEQVEANIKGLENDGWLVSDDKLEEDDLNKGWSFASAATSTTSIAGILAVPMIGRLLGISAGPVIGGALAVAVAGYSLYKSAYSEDISNENKK